MKIIDKAEANELINPLGLKIGEWNQIESLHVDGLHCYKYIPSKNAIDIYFLVGKLLNWINVNGWILYQIDNSTFPLDDEIKVLEKIVSNGELQWDVSRHHSFLFCGAESDGDILCSTTLVFLLYFSILFEWHIYMVSEGAAIFQRLAIIDGVIYFMGGKESVESGMLLIEKFFEVSEYHEG